MPFSYIGCSRYRGFHILEKEKVMCVHYCICCDEEHQYFTSVSFA